MKTSSRGKYWLLGIILLCAALPVFSSSTDTSPSLTGLWTGIMTQPGGPYAEYLLRVEITQNGPEITGTSRIEIPGTRWYGDMPIEGQYLTDTLRYKEGWMVAENIPSEIAWCLKQVTLTYLPAKDSLSADSLIGRWESPPCLPGEIRLARTGTLAALPDSRLFADSAERFVPDSLAGKERE